MSKPHSILVEEMADELFQMQLLSAAQRSRSKKRGAADLSDSEFLTLEMLVKHGSLTVGELQKQIGIMPAQMSRVIRSLEGKHGGSLIKCTINPKDKRKIDVVISKAGRALYKNFRQVRISSMVDFLKILDNKDCREFMRICRIIRGQIEKALD